jgi:hypothetical protein
LDEQDNPAPAEAPSDEAVPEKPAQKKQWEYDPGVNANPEDLM